MNYRLAVVMLCFALSSLPVLFPARAAEKTTAERATSTGKKIDLNKATQAELESLPGVGPATASSIIAARPFNSIEELKNVSGISEARFKEIQKQITVSRPTTATAAKTTPDQRKTASTDQSSTRRPAAAPSTAPATSARIDLNSADAATLETLPGVGPATARNIIAARPFKSIDDLKDVSGIGDARFQEIRSLVTVRNNSTRSPAAGSPAASTVGKSPATATERRPDQGTSSLDRKKINVNTATQQELESLLGIGPANAQAIIENRPYKSIDDVMKVKGIKDGTFEKIQDRITVR